MTLENKSRRKNLHICIFKSVKKRLTGKNLLEKNHPVKLYFLKRHLSTRKSPSISGGKVNYIMEKRL